MTTELFDQFIGTGEVKGFIFTRIDLSEKAYLYEVLYGSGKHYEVFKRVETPVCIDFENRVYSETDTRVVYPKSKDFGVTAWTFTDLELAEQRFNEIK